VPIEGASIRQYVRVGDEAPGIPSTFQDFVGRLDGWAWPTD
jgi:hypothetical protein